MRSVDVVPANWYDTNDFARTQKKVFRGVHLLDYHKQTREEDVPFLHGEHLDIRDRQFDGNVRRVVRLCKSLKYDSGRKDMPSSYDIESIIYRMPEGDLGWTLGQELQLSAACHRWLERLLANAILRTSLHIPDGKRKIFTDGHTTVEQLRGLHDELGRVLADVERGLARSFRKLSDARLEAPLVN